jgi:hypothetical protein
MKKWNTIQELGLEIARIDKVCQKQKSDLNQKELNIAQCTHIAKVVRDLYKPKQVVKDGVHVYSTGGKDYLFDHLFGHLDSRDPKVKSNYHGLILEEKLRAEKIVKDLFKYHCIPFSRIRRNMKRICK